MHSRAGIAKSRPILYVKEAPDMGIEMRVLFVPLIAGLLTIGGCSREDRTKTAASGVADVNLEQSIQTRFAADTQLQNSSLSVTANAEKSEIVLSGTVPSEEARSRAVEVAKEVSPGVQVIDTINVNPTDTPRREYTELMARRAREKALVLGDRVGNSLDDAWLYTKVMTRLTTNTGVPALKINVDVADSVVTLRGVVDSAARKDEAEKIAKETDGVKRVDDRLQVRAG
jgi:osmotically-inducible protein OsmY